MMRKYFSSSRLHFYATLFAFLTASIISSDAIAQTYKTYTVAEVNELIKKDSLVVLLDVRTEEEYNSEFGHLKNAKLIPVQELESRLGELVRYKKRTIVAYCGSGARSRQASIILSQHGFSNVINMKGGMGAWAAAYLPTVKEKTK